MGGGATSFVRPSAGYVILARGKSDKQQFFRLSNYFQSEKLDPGANGGRGESVLGPIAIVELQLTPHYF